MKRPPKLSKPGQVAKHKTSSRHRIIPPEEDMRRLFQECKVGSGNASLLSEALAFAKPEDLKNKDIIRVSCHVSRDLYVLTRVQEFYARCRASQELIFAQIPWASAGAERSRAEAGRGSPRLQKRKGSGTSDDIRDPRALARSDSHDDSNLTQEELLLAELLRANEELTDALRQYEDLERVGMEWDAEERSKKETRIDRSVSITVIPIVSI